MLLELNLTQARQGFSSLYDQVFNAFRPAIVTRNKHEQVLILRTDLQKALLSLHNLTKQVEKSPTSGEGKWEMNRQKDF